MSNIEPELGQTGFIPLPGILVCGKNLYIKTSPMFEQIDIDLAREVSASIASAFQIAYPDTLCQIKE
jgi:hypothetical protein